MRKVLDGLLEFGAGSSDHPLETLHAKTVERAGVRLFSKSNEAEQHGKQNLEKHRPLRRVDERVSGQKNIERMGGELEFGTAESCVDEWLTSNANQNGDEWAT